METQLMQPGPMNPVVGVQQMGLQPVPAQQQTLHQRAMASCAGGQMMSWTAVFCNVVLVMMGSSSGSPVDDEAYMFRNAYLGASFALVGGALGSGYGALHGGTVVSVVLSLPIAVMGLIVAIIIMGQIPYDSSFPYYCAKVGWAHFCCGVSVGGAGLAGGLAIGGAGAATAECEQTCGPVTDACSCMCVPKTRIGCVSRGIKPVCVLPVLLVLQLTANDLRHPHLRGGQLHLPSWHDYRPRHVRRTVQVVPTRKIALGRDFRYFNAVCARRVRSLVVTEDIKDLQFNCFSKIVMNEAHKGAHAIVRVANCVIAPLSYRASCSRSGSLVGTQSGCSRSDDQSPPLAHSNPVVHQLYPPTP
jgi:hypothetical protein